MEFLFMRHDVPDFGEKWSLMVINLLPQLGEVPVPLP